jgi:hypothetical protein
VRNYTVVTLAYWADTLADGAIRTLVLFYFYELGYTALQVASLFLFYEVFGILTNLYGGYLGARFGLKRTLFLGLGTQLVALAMLGARPESALTVAYVMASQALSGIAKDLTKMSSKSAVKLVAGDSQGRLYRWVAVLTGSKNALKGVGFFLGSLMLSTIGFQAAVWVLWWRPRWSWPRPDARGLGPPTRAPGSARACATSRQRAVRRVFLPCAGCVVRGGAAGFMSSVLIGHSGRPGLHGAVGDRLRRRTGPRPP